MNYGRWFTLDIASSDLGRGISVFNYRGFKFKKKLAEEEYEHEDGCISTPEYPIYATFSSDGIRFCCHYALLDANRGNKHIYHQDNMILSLEISSNTMSEGDLQRRLNEAYSAIYPREKNPIGGKTGKKFFEQFDKQIMQSVEKQETEKNVTYSSLDIFRLDVKTKDEIKEYNRFVIRKLFLDFLYDFEHTDVFQNSPHYDKVYGILHNDFLFDAIAKKAEYYYHRRIISKLHNNLDGDKNSQKYFQIHLNNYSLAEERWVDCILNPNSDKVFYDSDWIHSSKKELDDVYNYRSGCIDMYEATKEDIEAHEERKHLEDRISSTAERAQSWYIRKYDLQGALYVLFGERNPMLWLFMCVTPLFPFARKFYGTRNIVRWTGLLEMFMPRMFAAIFAAWFSIYSFADNAIDEAESYSVNINNGILYIHIQNRFSIWPYLLLVLALILMLSFLYSEIKKKTKYTYFDHREDYSRIQGLMEGTIMRRSLAIFAIAFQYSCIVALLMFKITKLNPEGFHAFLSIIVAMFLGIFVQMIFDDKSVSESFK